MANTGRIFRPIDAGCHFYRSYFTIIIADNVLKCKQFSSRKAWEIMYPFWAISIKPFYRLFSSFKHRLDFLFL